MPLDFGFQCSFCVLPYNFLPFVHVRYHIVLYDILNEYNFLPWAHLLHFSKYLWADSYSISVKLLSVSILTINFKTDLLHAIFLLPCYLHNIFEGFHIYLDYKTSPLFKHWVWYVSGGLVDLLLWKSEPATSFPNGSCWIKTLHLPQFDLPQKHFACNVPTIPLCE